MTKEEIAKKGIANLTSLNILSDSQKGKPIKLKEFLMLYIDDMKMDCDLIEKCRTDRERSLAYAIIALNDRIMKKADPMETYNDLITNKPITQDEFDKISDERNGKFNQNLQ